ncbi:MAG TPA: beta-L-arabinofuranosidase domain-containing protein, partial [Polyangiaceae bacterium]|nr:beta-L-arabinofuranosidase domain-containing protein [Polyangiaceae bacterium]
LYNAVLPGISLDGEHYFYQNPLAAGGAHRRRPWFGCACCPPNAMRLLASLGQYLATESSRGIELHLYAPAAIETREFGLEIETRYPWEGEIHVRVVRAPSELRTLALRVPGWCREAELRLNERTLPLQPQGAPGLSSRDGYLRLERHFAAGDRLRLKLDMPVRLTESNARVDSTRGAVAIERGPLVYAAEGVDNDAHPYDLSLDALGSLRSETHEELLGGIALIKAGGFATSSGGELYPRYGQNSARGRPTELTLIPYFARSNRGKTPLRVWLSLAR